MGTNRVTAATYYYAGGEKVPLAPADDLLAVDDRGLAAAAVPAGVRAAVSGAAGPKAGGVRVVHRADLGAEVADALGAAGALHPVFRAGGAVLVALPEVRVEESRAAARERLDSWLTAHAEAVVESRDDDRLVLRPASGSGADALGIANALAEQVGPEMAQCRFLRVTPRPPSQ